MSRLLLSSLLVTVLSLASEPILKTGQVTSYDYRGNIVTDGSMKDDGYYQAGTARSFSRTEKIVTDHTTGLQWQDDEDIGVIKKPWVNEWNYDAGNYNDTLGNTAATYCTDLPLDGGGWRLPSREEFLTLKNYGQGFNRVIEGIFKYSPYSFWTNSTYAHSPYSAWYIDTEDGYVTEGVKEYTKYVRCVRGKQLNPSMFSRNNVTEIVSDLATGLQWQDNIEAETNNNLWYSKAIEYCENTLKLGGYNDWRLPNINELYSIVDITRTGDVTNTLFQHTGDSSYWSSTTNTPGLISTELWSINFSYNGVIGSAYSQGRAVTRCVRGGQLGHSVNSSIIMYLLN